MFLCISIWIYEMFAVSDDKKRIRVWRKTHYFINLRKWQCMYIVHNMRYTMNKKKKSKLDYDFFFCSRASIIPLSTRGLRNCTQTLFFHWLNKWYACLTKKNKSFIIKFSIKIYIRKWMYMTKCGERISL